MKNLHKTLGERTLFQAKIVTYAWRKNHYGYEDHYVLLQDVRLYSGPIIQKQIWVRTGKWSEKLRTRMMILFEARLETDHEILKGRRTNYRLTRITKVRKHPGFFN